MISHLAQQREGALRSKYHELERILKVVMYENRIRGECLEVAMETLELYTTGSTDGVPAQGILAEIEARLAQLEPEEEMG